MRGVLLDVVCCEHGVLCKVACHKLRFLVPAYPRPNGGFGDRREVRHEEHVHEHLEVRLVECSFLLTSEPGHPLQVEHSKAEVI